MKHQFTLDFWQDDGWFVGRLREVPGVFSQGETLEELERNIEDAYQLMAGDEVHAPQGAQSKPLLLDVA
jgi:predicted RNase H-like HicB family nuclease